MQNSPMHTLHLEDTPAPSLEISSAPSQNKQQHIRIEKIKLLYQHSFTPIILSAVAGLFLVAALWKSANHQHLLIWLGTTFVFACARIWLMTQFKRENPQGSAVLEWEKPYALSLMAVFLVWSLGLICIMPRDNLSAVFILNTFSIGNKKRGNT